MLKPSFMIGPYKLIEPIGRGGMAQVFRGQRIGPGDLVMPCAVKLMLAEFASKEKFQRMFLEEARLSMRVSHSNICRVLSAGSEPRLHIAMEWINGKNLAEVCGRLQIVQEPLPYEMITYIIHSLLLALEAAHKLRHDSKPFPIIHRDVSPQNVMLSVHGEVKLMDFGIARVLADETSPAEFAGKLRYTPREQIMGRLRPATDLYAVGAILHELIEGSLFRADCTTKAEMLASIHGDQVPVLTRPLVPEVLRKLHKALLQPDPEARIQSATEAIAMLGPVVSEQVNLGQLIKTFLGSQATMSGSTMGDVAIPPKALEVLRAAARREDSEPLREARDVRAGGVIKRTPTDVVSKGESDGLAGVIPQPRERPRARWFRMSNEGGGRKEDDAPAEQSVEGVSDPVDITVTEVLPLVIDTEDDR